MHRSLLFTLFFASLPYEGLSAKARPSTFELYAYGQNYGGLALFYSDGLAYAGNPTSLKDPNAAAVKFSTTSSGAWIGSPETTSTNTTSKPNWFNATLFVPASSSTDKRIGFLAPSEQANSSVVATGFGFYGSTAMRFGGDGSVLTEFYALEVKEGLVQLFWNDTTEGKVPVTLRSVAPSNLENLRS